MKKAKKFTFDTPIMDGAKVIAYARISGIGYWHNAYVKDWANQECELEDIASFDIEQVIVKYNCKEQDITLAYGISKDMRDNLADAIEKPTLAHMELIFSDAYEKESGILPKEDVQEGLLQDREEYDIDRPYHC